MAVVVVVVVDLVVGKGLLTLPQSMVPLLLEEGLEIILQKGVDVPTMAVVVDLVLLKDLPEKKAAIGIVIRARGKSLKKQKAMK